eukprot:TRINITY_DN74_c0_g1_i1.p1 TRINITY_DN74_c0_g1~~TRINITY_DN74_c0_g1_i1.p1  ORF type:complete len:363 (+),score=72.20 TRINITY_DN74_c0_g1_i1:225-1313(+)
MWYTDVEDDLTNEATQDIHARFCPRTHIRDNIQTDVPRVSFKSKVQDIRKGISLFGTVPPPKKLSSEQMTSIAACVAESLRTIHPDAVVVYDIQDEPSRNGTERPFPFLETHEPRIYGQLIENLAPGTETIVFRAMTPNQSAADFAAWLSETIVHRGAKNMVLVGGSRQPGETLLSVQQAAAIARQQFPDLFLGGITIPERHRDRGNEHLLISGKVDEGVGFFTSQVVYNADNAIWMLKDYDSHCKQHGKQPVRLVFTFAPFGSESTVQFLRWLGVELPDGTVKRVLSRPNLKSRVQESIEICFENWKRILDASKRLKISIPIGFSVESVSKSKMEQDGAVELFSSLKEEMELYYRNLAPAS